MAEPRTAVAPSDPSYLSPDQQDLLFAALNSQTAEAGRHRDYIKRESDLQQDEQAAFLRTGSHNPTMTTISGSALEYSPQQGQLDGTDADFTPELDYLDGDSFDFDNADLGGDMIGALPGTVDSTAAEQHEKRKIADDDQDTAGDAKRQEGAKVAKKPGRKPLTNEPTTKRKAQNRAAQRAFRERKELHLKDLETKVTELTKADEASKTENGMLKAQIERLQVELRGYRKRLSLNSSTGRSSSPSSGHDHSLSHRSSNGVLNPVDFNFDFPAFGALPGSGTEVFGNSTAASANAIRSNSTTPRSGASPATSFGGGKASRSASSGQNGSSVGGSYSSPSFTSGTSDPTPPSYDSQGKLDSFGNSLPQLPGASNDPLGDLFSPSILKTTSMDSSARGQYFGPGTGASRELTSSNVVGLSEGDSHAGFNRVFQFNSGSGGSDSASPSGSSNWNAVANSSCGTSPEPLTNSPANKDHSLDSFSSVTSNNAGTQPHRQSSGLANTFLSSSEDFSVPTSESFDPVLFSGYRDNNEAIVGDGDFSGGFFDDALNTAPFDFASPSNLFGILQSPQPASSAFEPSASAANAPTPSQNLMAKMDQTSGGVDDDYGLPSTTAPQEKKMISCNNIWSQLQANPGFQDGKFDLDSLCAELRTKARCSESGVLVDQKHVDAALQKLASKDADKAWPNAEYLMFPQDSWDNVMKKMGK